MNADRKTLAGRADGSAAARPPHWPFPVLAAAGLLTLALFVVAPLLDRWGSGPDARIVVRAVDTAPVPAPPPPPPPPAVPDEPPPPVLPEPVLEPDPPPPRVRPESASWRQGLAGRAGDVELPLYFPPVPPSAAPLPELFEIADLDEPPRPLAPLRPRYPFEERRLRITGAVLLEFTVDEEGRCKDIRNLTPQARPAFVKASVRAVESWRLAPGVRDGQPVPARVRQRISFELEPIHE